MPEKPPPERALLRLPSFGEDDSEAAA